jgi:hypothetical protein
MLDVLTRASIASMAFDVSSRERQASGELSLFSTIR